MPRRSGLSQKSYVQSTKSSGLHFRALLGAHTSSTEGIALMMGGSADEPGGISSVVGVPYEELTPDLEKPSKRRRADKFVFTRWALVTYRFEKALYEDPDREDLNATSGGTSSRRYS